MDRFYITVEFVSLSMPGTSMRFNCVFSHLMYFQSYLQHRYLCCQK